MNVLYSEKRNEGNEMMRLSWLISCGIAIVGTMLVQYFYQFQSDTGNLGIVGLAIVIPFILLCIFITIKYFMAFSSSKKDLLNHIIFIVFGLLFASALIYYALDYRDTVFTQLGGSTKDVGSSIYGLNWLNVETSKIYFNFYTIILTILTSALIGYISGLFIKDTKRNELSELEQTK